MKPRIATLLLAATMAFGGLGFATGTRAQGQDQPAPTNPPAYRLQPGDEIAVTVFPQREYECMGAILPDGFLYLKNVGRIRAAGMTIDELTQAITRILERELVNPQVTVTPIRLTPPPKEPETPRQVTVVGAVVRSGPIELTPGLRVRKALDLAGGTHPQADLKNIIIIHRNLTKTIVDLSTIERVQDPEHNIFLQDGDSIEVRLLPGQQNAYVRILGQVANPGRYEFRPGMTLEDLILMAGRLTILADVENLQLRRANQPVRSIDLIQQQQKGFEGKVPLEPDDEVFVPECKDVVIVIGAVANPGRRRFVPGQTVRDFFVNGSPENAAAVNPAIVALNDVQLVRRGQAAVKLNLADVIRKPDHKDNVQLQNGDVLFLPPRLSNRRSVLDYLSQLGPLGWLIGVF